MLLSVCNVFVCVSQSITMKTFGQKDCTIGEHGRYVNTQGFSLVKKLSQSFLKDSQLIGCQTKCTTGFFASHIVSWETQTYWVPALFLDKRIKFNFGRDDGIKFNISGRIKDKKTLQDNGIKGVG